MPTESIGPALTLTLLAELATPVGSAIAVLAHHTSTRFLATSLGFSAGVMICVPFVELFLTGMDALLAESYGAHLLSVYALVGATAVMALSLLFL